jgi:SAM-dependent methyltransferase/uncharacterized protein YbaR (Trm112 family)
LLRLEYLRCPIDRTTLNSQGDALTCQSGHEFPVIQGVPVLLVPGVDPTLHVLKTSLEIAKIKGGANDDPLFLATLGISETQRAELAKDLLTGRGEVDPVVNYLVAHTNGILYKHLVGQLKSYPIPEIPLPHGGGRSLLDIGCNWGRWCVAAARKGYRPIGIDPSLGAVLAARRVAQILGVDADFIVADARYLPFADGSFDLVYSYSVLQHFSDPDLAVTCSEVSRVLTAQGCAKIQLANCYGIRSLYNQIRRGFREARGFEVRYRTPSAMARLFSETQFETSIEADCYFGLGLQAADASFMPTWKKLLLAGSQFLKTVATYFGPLRKLADSVFVVAHRR